MQFPPVLDEQVNRAVAILRVGGVVAYPTDTLYGLGAHALMEAAVERVYQVKGRREDMALPLLLADASEVLRVAVDVPALAWVLARRFWPGALTLVLPRASAVPLRVSGGRETVAVRVPAHPVPQALAQRLGAPITGTSANRSGQASPVTAEAVREALGGDVDLVIDCGPCREAIGSTVLDLTTEVPTVLRHGAVSVGALEQVCGRVEVASGTGRTGE